MWSVSAAILEYLNCVRVAWKVSSLENDISLRGRNWSTYHVIQFPGCEDRLDTVISLWCKIIISHVILNTVLHPMGCTPIHAVRKCSEYDYINIV